MIKAKKMNKKNGKKDRTTRRILFGSALLLFLKGCGPSDPIVCIFEKKISLKCAIAVSLIEK